MKRSNGQLWLLLLLFFNFVFCEPLIDSGTVWTRQLQQTGQIFQTLDPICQSPPHKITFPITEVPLSRNYSREIPSSTAHFPFIVSLQIFQEFEGIFVHFCGGVLLKPNIVLTAAHCVKSFWDWNRGWDWDTQDRKVRSYLVKRGGGIFAALNPFCRHQAGDQGRISVQDYIIHELYFDFPEFGNNIALLRLQTPFNYTGPYPTLETGNNFLNGTKALFAGWGFISAEEANEESTLYIETATYMRLKSLNFVPEDQCRMEIIKDVGYDILRDTMLCFKSPIYNVCRGDDGGPLSIYEYDVQRDRFTWRLLGISSWGMALDCNTTAKVEVFVKISKFVDWINEKQKKLSTAPTPTAPARNSSSVTTNATAPANVIGARSNFQDAVLNLGPSFLLKIQVRYWDQNEFAKKLSFCSGVLVDENWALMSYSCYLRILQFATDCELREVSCPNPTQLHKWFGDTNQQCFDINKNMQNMQIEVNAMGYLSKSFRQSAVPQFGVVFKDFQEIYINPENYLNKSADNQNDSFPVYVNDFLLLKLQGQFDSERLKRVKISAFDNFRKNISYKILFQNLFYQEDTFWNQQYEWADVFSESENEDFICPQKLQDSVCVQNQTICSEQKYVCGFFEFRNSSNKQFQLQPGDPIVGRQDSNNTEIFGFFSTNFMNLNDEQFLEYTYNLLPGNYSYDSNGAVFVGFTQKVVQWINTVTQLYTENQCIDISPIPSSKKINKNITSIISVTFCTIFLLIAIILWRRYKKTHLQLVQSAPGSQNRLDPIELMDLEDVFASEYSNNHNAFHDPPDWWSGIQLPQGVRDIPISDLKGLQRLGAGGFAVVYKAEFLEHAKDKYGDQGDKKVAVKIVFKEYLQIKDSMDAILKEVAAMSKLDSEYIVKLIGVSLLIRPSIIMELVPQGSLEDLLEADGYKCQLTSLPWKLKLMLNISKGIQYLHSKNVIHRDLKPQNILIENKDDATIKISDFGLAKIQKTNCYTKRVVGTRQYMAPEMFDKFVNIDEKIDIWALGVIMQQIMRGMRPWEGQNDNFIICRISLHQEAPDNGDLPKNCPQDLSELIKSCWKQRDQRPSSQQIVKKLENLLQQENCPLYSTASDTTTSHTSQV